MKQTDTKDKDTLGRSTFHYIKPIKDVRPTKRELRWLKHIERHGAQSSTYLYELTKDTHSCRDTSLRQLQKLRAGGFLHLPRQQRATENANFNSYIYDLTPKAKRRLFDHGISEDTVLPHGHWWHGYMTSCVTSSIDIMAARNNIRYIPGHEILDIKNSTLSIPMGKRKLIPDQLFALDYGGSYRAFALEVDRGTEPKTTKGFRKSYAGSIELYRRLIEGQVYKQHYGLKANLLVLWVFSNRTNEARFLEMVGKVGGAAEKSILTYTVGGFDGNRHAPHLIQSIFIEYWRSANDQNFILK